MPKRLSGAWFKLVEPDGFYLGILMVPEQVASEIERRDGPFRYPRRPPMSMYTMWRDKLEPSAMMDMQIIDLVPAPYPMTDAIMVFGISLSDLNKEPGFAFIPSADYLNRGPAETVKKTAKTKPEPVPNRFSVLDFT